MMVAIGSVVILSEDQEAFMPSRGRLVPVRLMAGESVKIVRLRSADWVEIRVTYKSDRPDRGDATMTYVAREGDVDKWAAA
jgi:hypothetical protein